VESYKGELGGICEIYGVRQCGSVLLINSLSRMKLKHCIILVLCPERVILSPLALLSMIRIFGLAAATQPSFQRCSLYSAIANNSYTLSVYLSLSADRFEAGLELENGLELLI
jgi:hypothetical protein